MIRPLALAALLLAAWPAVSPAAPTDTDKVFVGYLYQRPGKLNYSLYTHVCHAFAVPDSDGKLRPNDLVPSRELTAEAHKAGVKVLLSLGGWGPDAQFAAIASNPVAEERFAKAVMAMVDEFDYDGIDYDWEYPDTKEEVVGFERQVRRFRKELDDLGKKKGRPMRLTMAASSEQGTLSWLSKELVVENFDWLNVMTYDYAGDWSDVAGHNSPLFPSSKPGGKRSTATTMTWLVEERGFPPAKLAVGIPLYGRGFAAKEPYAPLPKKPAGERSGPQVPRGDYRNIHSLLTEKGWTRKWDAETKTPWAFSPDGNIAMGYDDVESVALKTEWAMKKGFRGVFFWQINADRLADGTNPLQEASRKKWTEAAKP